MDKSTVGASRALGLRAGEWVEVLSADEILATLDGDAALDALPFMPEMLQYCGKRYRVYKSAHKTCDTIERPRLRRMEDAVHLEGLRCDGQAHGGCEAKCLLFWKEAWLKRVPGPGSGDGAGPVDAAGGRVGNRAAGPDFDILQRATRAAVQSGTEGPVRYSCQATELLRATTDLHWWEPWQYLRDVTSRNVRLNVLIRYILLAVYNRVMRSYWRTARFVYPYTRGLAGDKTPTETLDLQPGELVQVRSKNEIMQTINVPHKNRGLSFDVEMVPFCGKTFRVHSRVRQVINEKTGHMIRIPGDCIILENVMCGGCLSRNRLFCPRSIYPYWREIWLRRVGKAASRPES